MSEWHPIETAPKDGTWVLLKGGKTQEISSWEKNDDDDRPVVAKFMTDNSDGYWTYAYWDSGWDAGWNSTYEKPTHWMPLPK